MFRLSNNSRNSPLKPPLAQLEVLWYLLLLLPFKIMIHWWILNLITNPIAQLKSLERLHLWTELCELRTNRKKKLSQKKEHNHVKCRSVTEWAICRWWWWLWVIGPKFALLKIFWNSQNNQLQALLRSLWRSPWYHQHIILLRMSEGIQKQFKAKDSKARRTYFGGWWF